MAEANDTLYCSIVYSPDNDQARYMAASFKTVESSGSESHGNVRAGFTQYRSGSHVEPGIKISTSTESVSSSIHRGNPLAANSDFGRNKSLASAYSKTVSGLRTADTGYKYSVGKETGSGFASSNKYSSASLH